MVHICRSRTLTQNIAITAGSCLACKETNKEQISKQTKKFYVQDQFNAVTKFICCASKNPEIIEMLS